MIESLYFDGKTADMNVNYTDGTHELFSPQCTEYGVNPALLPFNSGSATLILASLVIDLIQRVKELERVQPI